jgi:hypothetical protein
MTQSEGFLFFLFFWILYVNFKWQSKRRAWLFIDRGRILQKKMQIHDEIASCASKIDFWKKSWANYEAVVV